MLKDEWPMAERPKPQEVKAVRVIPWTPASFGVAVDYKDVARHCLTPGAPRPAAAEVRRLLGQHEGIALS
jgi:hypothetical protein